MSNTDPVTVGSDDGPAVQAANHSGMGDVDVERWARVAAETLLDETITGGHLDLTFIGPDDMAELNRTHMGHSGPTDVLSFPLDDGDDPVPAPGSPPVLLGDVVICPQVAAAQAPGHCGDAETELTLLVVHGVLHILGHDHSEPTEEAAMISRETHHLQRYGMGHPGPERRESATP